MVGYREFGVDWVDYGLVVCCVSVVLVVGEVCRGCGVGLGWCVVVCLLVSIACLVLLWR